MNEFVELQTAQAAPDGGGGSGAGGMLLFLAAMMILMWALLIRPQQRQQKEHRQMVASIQQGDRVVTSGGIHGKVTGVSDEVLTVEIADRVRIKVNRSAVTSRMGASEPAAARKEQKA